jgi:hypothetical protein
VRINKKGVKFLLGGGGIRPIMVVTSARICYEAVGSGWWLLDSRVMAATGAAAAATRTYRGRDTQGTGGGDDIRVGCGRGEGKHSCSSGCCCAGTVAAAGWRRRRGAVRGSGARGPETRASSGELKVKRDGLMLVSKLLGHALHSQSRLARKIFTSCREKFPL